MIFILNKQEKVVNILRNDGGANQAPPFFDDVYTQDLATGAETFSFSTVAINSVASDLVVGNYVAFKNEDGEYKLFQITQTEEYHQDAMYMNVYAEGAGLELINKVFRARKAPSTSLRRFMEMVLDDTGWNVGAIPLSIQESLDLDLPDATVYSTLQSTLSKYGVEMAFRCEINNGRISSKFIDLYSQRGRVTGKRFSFGRDIEGIKRKVDSTELFTALIGRGNKDISFKDVTVDGIDKPLGQDFIADQEAFDRYNNNGYHIVGIFKYDTDSPEELLRETHKQLEKCKEPKIEYEVSVALLGELLGESWNKVRIGDTVAIVDNAFNPPIHLMARVSKLEKSFTDNQSDTCTLSNFIEVKSNITNEMREIASKLEGYVDSQFPIGGDKIQNGAIGQDQMNDKYISKVTADIVKASVVEAEKVIAEEIEAVEGRFERLEVDYGDFKQITTDKINAVEGNFDTINSDLGNFKEVTTDKINAVEGNFNKINSDLIETNKIVADIGEFTQITAGNVDALTGNFDLLNADYGNFKELVSGKVSAVEGNFNKINADLIETNKIVANLGKFDDVIAERVDAVEGNFTELEAEVGKINTLVSGNITSDNIHSSGISSDKLTIRDGFIKNAMIDSVNASKINAGEINTNKVHITSENGGIVIADNTQQFKDKNGKVRIQMGQDAQGNFNFGVFDETGTGTLIDATGIKEKAIADGLIKDKMIGVGEIGGNKINISSMIEEVNKESNTKTIKGSKVQLDTQGQTLDVAFNTLKTNVDNIEIGGRNIATDTNQGTTGWAWGMKVGGATISEVTENGIRCCKMVRDSVEATSWSYINYSRISREKYKPSTKYTISFEVKPSIQTSFYVGIKKGDSTGGYCSDAKTDVAPASKWTKLTVTVTTIETLPQTSNQVLYLSGMSSEVGVSYIFRNLMIEEGTKASSWQPAPEDLDSKIQSNTTAISVQQGKINTLIQDTTIEKNGQSLKLKDEYSKLEQTVSGISSTVGSHTSSITNLGAQVDSKAKVFTSTPTVPYRVGDLWVQGSSGEIMKCKTARTTGSYNSSDWEKASKYTDDSKANQVESNLSTLSGKVTQVESKQASFKQDLDGFKQNVSSTYATKEQFNLANGKLNDLEKNVETTKSQVAEVTTSLDGITQRVNSTETKVESISKSVNDKANSKDVYTKSDVYTKNETNSQINIAKEEINLGVSNTYETKSNVETKISSAKTEAINSASADATSKVNSVKNELNTAISKKANSTDVYTKSEVYTKEETNSQINIAKDNINLSVSNNYETKANVENKISNVTNTLTSKIDGIQIGGRNLATSTNQGTTGWAWGMKVGGATISEVTENGIRCCKMVRDNVASTGWSYISYSKIGRDKYLPSKQYTISFEVKSSVVTDFWCSLKQGDSSNPLNVSDVKATVSKANTWTKLSFTLTTVDTLPTSTKQVIYLASMNSGTGVTYIFRNLMIEEGTKASSWSPAPEDVDALIDNVYGHINEQILEVKNGYTSSIEILQGKIDSNVEEVNSIKTGMTSLESTLSSNISQTAKDITTSLTEQIKGVGNDLQSFENTVTSYMKFDTTGLELGKTDSKFKAKLSTTKLSFLEDNTEVAYISNKKMYITDAEITNQLTIGKFAFVPRANGNTSLKWIG